MSSPKPIGFWLKLVDRLIDEQFAVTLEEHGVTRRQWQLLNVLDAGPSTVEQLDSAGAPFLADDDGESSVEHLTELTERGRAAFERLRDVVAERRTAATEGVTADEYEQTLAVLERVARNLGWSDPAA